MKDEIKAILDYLKDDKWDYYPNDGVPYKVFLMEERDKLLDYITNLQEENEKLNNRIHDITETLNETYNNRTKLRNENKELKSRINKAIEYIEKWRDTKTKRIDSRLKRTLEILKGE